MHAIWNTRTRSALAVCAALALSLWLASTASANTPAGDGGGGGAARRPIVANGWGYRYVFTADERPNYMGRGKVFANTAADGHEFMRVTAYNWLGYRRGWMRTSIQQSSVDVYPYGQGWSWVRGADGIWLAVLSRNVEVGYEFRSCSQPPRTMQLSYYDMCLHAQY